MAQKRVTIQEIADACKLSRNTVSKVFNQRGNVPESTRLFVLARAREMGYYAKVLPPASAASKGTIAVLSRSNPLNHNFGSMLMKACTDTICREGFSVQMYELSKEEAEHCRLPERTDLGSVKGFLCIELFDQSYLQMLTGLGFPIVSIDSYCGINRSAYLCDIITMENVSSVIAITRRMLAEGAKRLGFVGDILHCSSFHERWEGFCTALQDAGMEPDRRFCILARDGSHYANPEWTIAQLEQMPAIPDAFVCANDYHAVKLIQALKRIGKSVPGDVMVAGFDDSPEAAVIDPTLTTVFIPGSEIGVGAAELLLRRIRNKDVPRSLTYVQTTPVFRKSTCRNA